MSKSLLTCVLSVCLTSVATVPEKVLAGVLYGCDGATLYKINKDNGICEAVGQYGFVLTEFTYDWTNDRFYALGPDQTNTVILLYSVSRDTGQGALKGSTGLPYRLGGRYGGGLAWEPSTGFLYTMVMDTTVPYPFPMILWRIDPTTLETVPVQNLGNVGGAGATAMTFSPDGGFYFLRSGTEDYDYLKGPNGLLITGFGRVQSIAIDTDNQTAYLAGYRYTSGDLYTLNLATQEETRMSTSSAVSVLAIAPE